MWAAKDEHTPTRSQTLVGGNRQNGPEKFGDDKLGIRGGGSMASFNRNCQSNFTYTVAQISGSRQ